MVNHARKRWVSKRPAHTRLLPAADERILTRRCGFYPGNNRHACRALLGHTSYSKGLAAYKDLRGATDGSARKAARSRLRAWRWMVRDKDAPVWVAARSKNRSRIGPVPEDCGNLSGSRGGSSVRSSSLFLDRVRNPAESFGAVSGSTVEPGTGPAHSRPVFLEVEQLLFQAPPNPLLTLPGPARQVSGLRKTGGSHWRVRPMTEFRRQNPIGSAGILTTIEMETDAGDSGEDIRWGQ